MRTIRINNIKNALLKSENIKDFNERSSNYKFSYPTKVFNKILNNLSDEDKKNGIDKNINLLLENRKLLDDKLVESFLNCDSVYKLIKVLLK